jgi:non-ribosomal peptide synthetase component F
MVTLGLQAMAPAMLRLLGHSRLRALIVGNVAEMSGAPAAVGQQMRQAGLLADLPRDDRVLSFAQLLANDGRYERHAIADPFETLAVLQYTGGTTGSPKGAMLSHGNLTTACSQIWALTQGEPKVLELAKERLLVVLPLFQRRGFHLHRRPHQGHDPVRRLQRLSAQHRRGDLRPSCRWRRSASSASPMRTAASRPRPSSS